MPDEGAARDEQTAADGASRRTVLAGIAAGAAVGVAGVNGLAKVVQYVVPESKTRERETFLAYTDDIPEGGTLEVVLPDKRRIQVRKMGDTYAGFSNVCPHLGCRVTWTDPAEGETDPKKKDGYFRCPCHEGYFSPDGVAFSGPPADAQQSLTRVELVQRDKALYVKWQETVS